MSLNFLRLITIVSIFFHFGTSTAGEREKGIKRIAIPSFGLTADQLPDPQSKGAVLLASYCSQCHNLPSPKMHSTGDWPVRFEKMMDHAMLMSGASTAVKYLSIKRKKKLFPIWKRMDSEDFRQIHHYVENPRYSILSGSAQYAMPYLTQINFLQKNGPRLSTG